MAAKNDEPKSFTCTKCGKEHAFAAYVFAHWRDELEHKCDCGARHAIQRGKAWSLDNAEAEGEKTAGADSASVSIDGPSVTTPHAVRWAQRDVLSRFETEFSKWHWTTNATDTLCGRKIMLISDGPAMLPEANDDARTVDCKQCKNRLADNKDSGNRQGG